MIATATLLDKCIEQFSRSDAEELLPKFREAIKRYPVAPPLLYTIATTCLRYGYSDLWHYYRSLALALPHLTYEDRLFRGNAKLRQGEWSGWRDREARLLSPDEGEFWTTDRRALQWTTAAWDGEEDITDKTLLAIADGGFGDCFQMLRYVQALVRHAAHVIVSVRPECLSFARHCCGDCATVVARDPAQWPPSERYVWFMSLPGLLGFLPSFTPCSAPMPINLGDSLKYRIGICWAGASNQPAYDAGRDRSLSLADLAPLCSHDDYEVYSLQVGKFAPDASGHARIRQPPVTLTSFADTANVIAGLDCVVSIDTSIAHLAGILGAPTYVLLPLLSEFRWGRDDTTEWYPSIRLLRQRRRGDWSDVVGRLMDCLASRELPLHHAITKSGH